jgi:hypothetical protein
MLAVVVCLMTIHTVASTVRVKDGFETLRIMTTDAGLLSVHSDKIESTRDRNMVELAVTPGGGCVASYAGRGEARTLMSQIVPGLMARHTIRRGLGIEPWLEGLGNMAEDAWQAVVDPQELEPPTGDLVIEEAV